MSTRQNNATDGRVYGGDCGLIHVPDGTRAIHGKQAADYIEANMRQAAHVSGARTKAQAETQDLCPGCYMVVAFDAAVSLAKRSGQSLKELGLSMAEAFRQLAECGEDAEGCIEEIMVKLDGAAA